MAKQHWVDEIVEDARSGVKELVSLSQSALARDLPIGKRLLSKREQLQQFERLSPEDHEMIKQERGNESYNAYVESQLKNARQIFGEEYAAMLTTSLMQQGM